MGPNLSLDFLEESGSDIVLGSDFECGWVDGGCWGAMLHGEEGLDRPHFRLVRTVRKRLPLRAQLAGSHPSRVLLLL
jgi:hypothetical protein